MSLIPNLIFPSGINVVIKTSKSKKKKKKIGDNDK